MAKKGKSAATKAIESAVGKLNTEIQKLTEQQATIGDKIDELTVQRTALIGMLPDETVEVTEEAAQ